ncbi:unnamed protein product [Prorocentrum cordatum]|uniref:Secreted protein n=1 Tax=Prorocentrum cordatum TaxID=2364126 RepID=A0ABN9PCG7_9DINO|nr:unnamed protein product [Polarella glacialis]
MLKAWSRLGFQRQMLKVLLSWQIWWGRMEASRCPIPCPSCASTTAVQKTLARQPKCIEKLMLGELNLIFKASWLVTAALRNTLEMARASMTSGIGIGSNIQFRLKRSLPIVSQSSSV